MFLVSPSMRFNRKLDQQRSVFFLLSSRNLMTHSPCSWPYPAWDLTGNFISKDQCSFCCPNRNKKPNNTQSMFIAIPTEGFNRKLFEQRSLLASSQEKETGQPKVSVPSITLEKELIILTTGNDYTLYYIDHFYKALFSTLEQTNCARM